MDKRVESGGDSKSGFNAKSVLAKIGKEFNVSMGGWTGAKSNASEQSAKIEAWIEEVEDSKMILSASQSFKKVAYFGVSALGHNLQNGILVADPAPVRVENPFLWILYPNGLIKMKGRVCFKAETGVHCR